ncbi:MAG TPA: M20/M25/M40 family metallo-hydrolase [Methylomirabilota bacterium]|nr:M20/M25/M40 family metallo-hydrolase [Methylomirabilota bacterium]
MNAPKLLHRLLTAFGPSGAEESIQRVVHAEIKDVASSCTVDAHGNLLATLNPDAPMRVIIAAHCDQIGFLVQRVDSDGFLFVKSLGGGDEAALAGTRVLVRTPDGSLRPGVIGKKATHLETKKERDTVPTKNDIWIDIGAGSQEEAEKAAPIGTFVTFEPSLTSLSEHLVAAPALDNRLGLYVAVEAFKRLAKAQVKAAITLASTVQEELGSRGAITATQALKPHIGVVIDTANATDEPSKVKQSDERCSLGAGPTLPVGPNINRTLLRSFEATAKEKQIQVQRTPSADLESNDAKEIQVAASAVAVVSVGLPLRYMHTPAEVADLRDAEAAIELIAETLLHKLPNSPEELAPFRL